MNWNKSLVAFDDIRSAFEEALQSERGILITFESHGRAITERSRFNYYRKLNRAENEQTYERGHFMHGRSPYDALVLRIPPKGSPDSNILYIEKRLVEDMKIQRL